MVVVFGFLYSVFLYLCCRPQLDVNERAYRKVYDLQEQVKRESALGRDLQQATAAFMTDPKTVERVAREKFGYSKPGEEVIYFEPVLKKPGQP